MPYKVDYLEGDVVRWELTDDGGVEPVRDTEYAPTIYVSGESRDALAEIRGFLRRRTGVASTAFEEARTVWRNDPEPVLAVDVESLDAVTDVAHEVRGWGAPGEYRLYNVDFSREFRYCLETDRAPTPADDRALRICSLSVPPKQLSDGEITPLTIDGPAAGTRSADAGGDHGGDHEGDAGGDHEGDAGGDEVLDGSPVDVLESIMARLRATDPDVLVVSASALVPLLYDTAERFDVTDFDLGRLPGMGYQQLAAASTFESYGRVGHSPARYNVPGRVLIDRENTFFLNQTNLAGLQYLVGRSAKPLQETAWSSIGNVLTAIQIREARDRGVLVPWNSWRHEFFKPASTLHDADRGGFIFTPDDGFHEDVHELDFSALYPNIIVTRNVSPEVIRCDCHADRSDVPGLGYSICDDDGYLPDVLEPLIADRDDFKHALADLSDGPAHDGAARDDGSGNDAARDAERSALEGKIDALKWILVACFGYQGFSNAKFGRIECHEAINAFAREILLDTKERLEEHGWAVVHGIVDSVWVRAMDDREQTPLGEVADEITAEIGIWFEYEAHYDWIAFVPRRAEHGGALNRYFAKDADTGEYKLRGIELRQRSTPDYVNECQRELLDVLDETRDPAAVCDRLQVQIGRLRRGAVDPEALLVTQRVSKPLEAYAQYTRGVSAIERATDHDFAVNPGQSVRYLVVDDDKDSRARVRLEFEDLDRYDADFYADLLVRAAESVVSPLGWDRDRIRQHLADTDDATLAAYGA